MRIIVLWGKNNSGKTTTFLVLLDILKKKGFLPLKQYQQAFDNNPNYQSISDYVVVGKLYDKIIALTSEGDKKEAVQRNYNEIKMSNPDIWVCTSRTKCGSVEKIIELSNKECCEPTWAKVETFAEYPQNGYYLHQAQAESLLEMICND